MFNLNEAKITGYLTGDPETRALPSGKELVTFSLAYNEHWKQDDEWKEKAHFFFVECFGWAAKDAERLHKGQGVCVTGSLKQDRFEDKDGKPRSIVKISARKVQADSVPKQTKQEPAQTYAPTQETADDDLPF